MELPSFVDDLMDSETPCNANVNHRSRGVVSIGHTERTPHAISPYLQPSGAYRLNNKFRYLIACV
jgi:hypothetical protein